MSEFKVGDIVVLTAGSMRMAVESVDKEKIATGWCNEGVIGRDLFPSTLLKKWEFREEDKSRGPRANFARGNDKYDSKESPRSEKPRAKTGWDGKPREKKFFRKD